MAFKVYKNEQSQFVIWLGENKTETGFISLDLIGIKVNEMANQLFNSTYTLVPDYPVKQACELFYNYAKILGCEEDVLDYLSDEIEITEEEIKSIMEREPVKEKVVKAVKEKVVKEKVAKVVKETVVVEVKEPVVVQAEVTKSRRETPSKMFQDLLRLGTLTDEEIFKKVQDAHGLSDDKFCYVAIHRSTLKSKGEFFPKVKKC